MKVEIRDYRGCERADIDLSKIALVAGKNEMGKSAIAEATRAALSGNPIPIDGVLKKDAKLLVRDGATEGRASVILDGEPTTKGERTVCWPTAEVFSDGEEIKCSDYATGFTHILDLNSKDRSKVLAGYIKSVPTKDEVVKAAIDAGYTEAAIEKVWDSIDNSGWDYTYKRARDYTVTLKGQWQEVTGEKYGTKKGESYRVADGDEGLDALAEALATAEQTVLDTAGAVAVSDAEIANLERKVEVAADAGNVAKLNTKLDEVKKKLALVQQKRAECPDDPASVPDQPDALACPECGAALTMLAIAGGGRSLVAYMDLAKEEPLSPEAIKHRSALDLDIAEQAAAISGLEKKVGLATRQVLDGAAAAARLDEIEAAPKLDEVAIELAKDAVGDARSALKLFESKLRAYMLHGDLVKNDKLIGILAPDGLRKRKLAAKLGEFNDTLEILSTTASWPVVRLDENLDCHYGTRPIWGASKSGQWRARTIIQVAMAQIDGSAAVILDEADMLDSRGRNGLFNMLAAAQKACDLRALVCMTFSKIDKVPNLAEFGLGQSYWIDDGIAEAI